MNAKTIIIIALGVILGCTLSFGITTGLVYGICWAFNLNFSLKVAYGIWLIMMLLSGITIKRGDAL